MSTPSTKAQLAGTLALALTLTIAVAAQSRKTESQQLDRATALAAFERIKTLDGTWLSRSSKGWEERQQFRVIANGTAVASQSMPISSADGSKGKTSPNAPMLTMFHMDSDRLLLTHYCEAGNQPRMIATAAEDGGLTVRFSFLDATNMSLPTTGHMHAVVITFLDRNHFDERWSWYENGEEKWMETVHNELMPSSAGQP